MTPRELAASRIIFQYRNSAKFRKWIDSLPTIGERSLIAAFNAIIGLIHIDDAEGDQLDIIGRIVGNGVRPTLKKNDLQFFAYEGTPSAQPYDVAPYIGDDEESYSAPISDDLYRVAIRAKIVQNTSFATIDDIKSGIEYVLGEGYTATVVDLQDMRIRVILNQEPAYNVKALLQVYPLTAKPAGVSIEYITSVPNQDTPGAFAGDEFASTVFGG